MGMGDCPPTDAEAQQALENYLRAIFKSTSYSITSFQKTNGQALNAFGMSIYNYEFTAAFTLPNGSVPDVAHRDLQTVCSEGPYDNNRCRFAYYIFQRAFDGLNLMGPQAKQLHRPNTPIKLSATLKFEKTERGWRNNQQLSI